MTCVRRFDLCITRGSRASHSAVLRQGFDEVIETPLDWRGRLVFREVQDDTVPDIFALVAVPEVVEDPCQPGQKMAVLQFDIAGSLTAILPPYDVVAFVELQEFNGDNLRLYNMRVRIGD